MAIRSFIFCNLCNPRCIRDIEMRRLGRRDGQEQRLGDGRRVSDGRSWFDGTAEEAVASGWKVAGEDTHICPYCRAAGGDSGHGDSSG